MEEKVIQTKACTRCKQSFEITDQDILFLDKLSPTIAWQKYNLPVPDMCPLCRQQQRCAFRNRRNLYKRKCDLTGRPIISMYSPDKPYKIYYNKDYETKFDAIDYAKEIDLTRSMLTQLKELQLQVPRFHSAVVTDTMENAEYVNGSHGTKDSYLSFSVTECEKVYYCEGIYRSVNCIDCYHVHDCELCYECIESSKMYKSIGCNYCVNCSHCTLCFDCENCQNCFGCVNQVGKSYCIFNQQYSKEDYAKELAKYIYSEDMKKQFHDFQLKFPHKYARLVNTENSTGDDLINAKNCINCFGLEDAEDMRHCFFLNEVKSCMDMLYYGTNLERWYRSVTAGGNAQNIYFCMECYKNCSNLYYCDNCVENVRNCFACIGLKNKEFCIFNKQYTRQEYEKLIPQIIEKMKSDWERWMFLPPSYSPFGYNESLANEHFPLNKKQAQELWFNWMDAEYAIDAPKDLQANPEIVVCEVTGKPFRLIKQELEFYKKLWLPLPHRHPNQRHKERFAQVNLKRLRDRKCDKCWVDIKTTYSPERKEIVYCEACYNKEVYW